MPRGCFLMDNQCILNNDNASKLARYFPFLAWFPLKQKTLTADVVAGITVAMVAVPQSLAYAQLAGVPPYFGLYAAFIPTIVGALFGSSGVLSTGPVAMTSLLTFASVSLLAPRGSEQFISYVILLALLSGIFQVLFGMFRLGVLLNFLSHPVLMGFINAAAIIIALSQLPALLGIAGRQSDHLLLDVWHVLVNIDALHEISLAFGLSAMLMLFAFRKTAPRFPGVLITTAILTSISYAVGYAALGGRVVGEIPQGMPQFSVPPFDLQASAALLPAAFVIALISFMEAMSSCKVIAIKTRTPWDENQELIALGIANVATGFFQGFSVSSSASRTPVAESAGARTQMTCVVGAVCIALLLLFAPGLMLHVPIAALAAVVISVCYKLVEIVEVRRLYYLRRGEFVLSIVCFLGVALLGVVHGIFISVGFALLAFIWRAWRPYCAVLGRIDGIKGYHDITRHPEARRIPGLVLFRWDAPLFFANAEMFREQVLRAVSMAPTLTKWVVVAAEPVTDVDITAADVLAELVEELHRTGIELCFAQMKGPVKDHLKRYGLFSIFGVENFFPTIGQAVDHYLLRHPVVWHDWDDDKKSEGIGA